MTSWCQPASKSAVAPANRQNGLYQRRTALMSGNGGIVVLLPPDDVTYYRP